MGLSCFRVGSFTIFHKVYHDSAEKPVSHTMTPALIIILFVFISGCLEAAPAPAQVYGYEIIETCPHDPAAFTQGLVYHNGTLYESTGLYGQSSLREVDISSGQVLRMRGLPAQFFGEGLCLWQDELIQLTWRSRGGFIWNLENFSLNGVFSYPSEGWGLAQNGEHLIMSDGTATLHVLDPVTLREVNSVHVLDKGVPVKNLNELEYVKGEIYANVWKTDRVVRISPKTGEVLGWINLSGLLSEDEKVRSDVLNGIAYDPRADRFFVTGKFWPKLFQIKIRPRADY